MGSGYNDSLAASKSARSKASTRTPVHFYLAVPYYEYDLGCGRNQHLHTFQSRTPFDSQETVWCSGCEEFRTLEDPEPLNRPVSTDELVAFEQDKGILRERIARVLQDMGFLSDETQIMEMAIKFGVPVAEIKRINAGLRAPEGLSGLPDMCSKGLHEMTVDNIAITRGRRQCKACRADAQRARRASNRGEAAVPTHNRRVAR